MIGLEIQHENKGAITLSRKRNRDGFLKAGFPSSVVPEGFMKEGRKPVQAKLETTVPGDPLEKEADSMADVVMQKMATGTTETSLSSSVRPCPSVNAYGGTSAVLPPQMESQLTSSQGGGHAMPSALQSLMEGAFGQSFSNVRLHTDSSASEMSRSIGARAFTYKDDVYFNSGQFQPESAEGQHLIAHELAHTIQQHDKVSKAPAKKAPPVIKAKDSVPSDIRDIGVTTVEQENALIAKLLKCVLVDNKAMSESYERQTITIKKDDTERFSKLKKVIVSCQEIIKVAVLFQNDNTKKGLVQDLVQNVYNALSFVSVAMDMLWEDKQTIPKESDKPDKDTYGNPRSFISTTWSSLRDQFISVVRDLALLTHNPAIAVLAFEGTYYPKQYNKITSKSVRKAVGGDTGNKAPYSILQQTYGLVCNNVVFGSMVASGVNYDYELDAARSDKKAAADKKLKTEDQVGLYQKKLLGLDKGDRLLWSEYKLVGNGEGEGALEGAKQGDVLVFWNTIYDKKFKVDPILENAEANHIEIIAGVGVDVSNQNETMFLLSGAHGKESVNGWTREGGTGGQLYWKNAKDIREKRYMMRIPTTNDNDRIPVNIPSIMQDQKYESQIIGNYEVPNPKKPKQGEMEIVDKVMYLNTTQAEISFDCLIKKGI